MRLTDSVDEFLTAKEAANLSAATLDFYRRNLAGFMRWLERSKYKGDNWCNPATIEGFLANERRRKMSPATVHARYRALRVYFAWLESRHGVPSPVRSVAAPATPAKVPRQIEIEDLDRIVEAIPSGDTATWTDLRDRLLLVLFFWTGLRLGEMAALTLDHVDVKKHLIYVASGKGGKGRYVPIPSGAPALLLAYLVARPPWSGPELFLGNDGAHGAKGVLAAGGIRQMIKRRCRAANVTYANPHAFRHGFAMMLLNSGGIEMGVLSKLLGHSSTKITQEIYADWETESLRKDYNEAVRNVRQGRGPRNT